MPPDKPSLLNEVNVQKQLFVERLSKAYEELKEQGERGCPPHPALLRPPALRLRAESSLTFIPAPYRVPVHTSHHPFLLTPHPAWLCLPPWHLSFSIISPSSNSLQQLLW